MTQNDYLDAFGSEYEKQRQLSEAKGTDYSGTQDVFKNFRMVEQLGICPTEVGILTRMSDKFARLSRLIGSGCAPTVPNESVIDTLRDLSIYSKILIIYLENKGK